MTKPIIFLLAMMSSAFTITPVVAAETAASSSVVRTADLDLGSKAGQRLLDRRVSRAVAEVCGIASDADLAGQNRVRECFAETRSRVASVIESRLASASRDPIVLATR